MPLGTNHVTNTTHDVFIPELWSDEVIADYKANLVMANLVTKINHNKQKGDTIHIPNVSRGDPSVKAAESQVALIADTETDITIVIDQHYEYSRLIEDRTDIQSIVSGKNFYANDAGYALAKRVDTDLAALGAVAQGGTAYDAAVLGSDGSTTWTTGAATAIDLTDIAIRNSIQIMDDQDVPMTNRCWVVAPSQRNALMGIERFTQEAFVGERGADNTIRNGRIGNLYGDEVYVSTNTATPQAGERANLHFHKDAFVHAEQLGIRSQFQYKQEYLGTLFTADTLYGTRAVREDSAVVLMTR